MNDWYSGDLGGDGVSLPPLGLHLGAAAAVTDVVGDAWTLAVGGFPPCCLSVKREELHLWRQRHGSHLPACQCFTLRLLVSCCCCCCCWAASSRFCSLSFAVTHLFTFIGIAAACGTLECNHRQWKIPSKQNKTTCRMGLVFCLSGTNIYYLLSILHIRFTAFVSILISRAAGFTFLFHITHTSDQWLCEQHKSHPKKCVNIWINSGWGHSVIPVSIDTQAVQHSSLMSVVD